LNRAEEEEEEEEEETARGNRSRTIELSILEASEQGAGGRPVRGRGGVVDYP
jgi:hypothetical protein